MNKITQNPIDSFKKKIRIDPKTKCWIWLACQNSDGYGKFHLNGKSIGAHRASLILFKGKHLTKNDIIHHLCHSTNCVNPDHLEATDHNINNKDPFESGRRIPSRSKTGTFLSTLDSNSKLLFSCYAPGRDVSNDSACQCKNCGFIGTLADMKWDGLTFFCPGCDSRDLVLEVWWASNKSEYIKEEC
uniref:Putative homing endonuclease n=1 Tax=viral metagenome TaxID=1070528 RepID=A0A6M3KLN0_9ZZZZ